MLTFEMAANHVFSTKAFGFKGQTVEEQELSELDKYIGWVETVVNPGVTHIIYPLNLWELDRWKY